MALDPLATAPVTPQNKEDDKATNYNEIVQQLLGFPIENPTLGGGTEIQQLGLGVADIARSDRFGRASVGSDVFGGLLNAELSARRRPVSIVDQLLLANQFGSVLPLSQLGDRALTPRTNPALGSILDELMRFISGENIPSVSAQQGGEAPGQQVPDDPQPTATSFGDSRDALLALQGGDQEASQAILRREAGLPPVKLAHGGTLTVDTRRRKTVGTSVAGPATVVDSSGQAAAVIGEAGGAETVSNVEQITNTPHITPQDQLAPPVQSRTFGGPGTEFAQNQPGTGQFLGQPRDVLFRMEAIREALANTGFGNAISDSQALQIAQRPEDFNEFTGQEFNPTASSARLLGGALTADQRFSDPLVRALARGRAPNAAETTAQEFAALPPDMRNVLIDIIGVDQLPGFLFAVGQGTPTGRGGVRHQAAGGVRV